MTVQRDIEQATHGKVHEFKNGSLGIRILSASFGLVTRRVSFEVAHFQARRAVTALAGGVNHR